MSGSASASDPVELFFFLVGPLLNLFYSLIPILIVVLVAKRIIPMLPKSGASGGFFATLQDTMAQARNTQQAGGATSTENALDDSDLDAVNELRAASGLPPLTSLDGDPDDSPEIGRAHV